MRRNEDMEPETDNTSDTDTSCKDDGVPFSHVSAVATGWMFDFMFVSLCRHFKKGKLDAFNEALSTVDAFPSSLKGAHHNEKRMISAFLARVMHGKQLDVLFEDDIHVMPLMSAAKIWSKLEDSVADESLFKNITILLLVQSVAVCLEQGQRSTASSVLKWFENNHEFPQNLRVKLATIVTKADTYHPFLMSFSFSRLQETVQSYLDGYLEKNPSDFLLKAATEMVQSSEHIEGLEDAVRPDCPLSTVGRRTKERDVGLKTKRKLLSTKVTKIWTPDAGKKAFVSVRRLSRNEISLAFGKSPGAVKVQKARKPQQKWTPQLDKYLKEGVKRHGQGKWSRILLDYDFEGRTGTMLKDRWRVLLKAYEVS